MAKLKLTGKQLRNLGYPEGPVISIAMNIMEKNFKHLPEADALEILSSILQSPNQYAHDGVLGKIAEALLPKKPEPGEGVEVSLNQSGIQFNVAKALSKVLCTRCTQQPNCLLQLPVL
jgi:tRNA-splicing ligase RtcB (3'-phosphate/5'-hydroxy nucleic acid ligase)